MSMRDMVENLIKPLRNRVYTMITRAIIESVKDGDGMQLVKVSLLAGENRDDAERFQNFGFSSVPPDGSECVAVSIGGNRDHLIIIVADDRNSRITGLAKGESVFYNSKGDKLVLKASGNLEGTLSANFEITGKKYKFQGDSAELLDELVKIVAALKVEPFIVNKATFTLIETNLKTLKV